MDILNAHLRDRDIVLLLKLHLFQRRGAVAIEGLSHIKILENDALVREDIQLNEILGHADALISDYSSAAIDFTLLDRPIAFTLEDCEEYGDNWGFNWPNVRDYLPGEEFFTFDDFLRFVKDVATGEDRSREKRQRLCRKFHAYFDDGSSARVLKALGIER